MGNRHPSSTRQKSSGSSADERHPLLAEGNRNSITISPQNDDDDDDPLLLQHNQQQPAPAIITHKRRQSSIGRAAAAAWKRLAGQVETGNLLVMQVAGNEDDDSNQLYQQQQPPTHRRRPSVFQRNRQNAVERIRSSMEFSLKSCVIAIGAYLAIAVVAFSVVLEQHWSVIDSMYFAVVTFTTIGYGDLVPQGFAARIFTCFWALIGVACLGIGLGVIGNRLIEAQHSTVERARELSKQRALSLFRRQSSISSSRHHEQTTTTTTATTTAVSRRGPSFTQILLEFVAVIVMLATFGFLLADDPGIDITKNDDGTTTSSWPRRTGNALYFTIITATTIGYGDFSPQSQKCRLMAVFLIPMAVGAMGHWLSVVAGYIIENRQSKFRQQRFAQELTLSDLDVMDEDGDGQVTQVEFLEFMLMAMNKVDADTVKQLRDYFARLDRTGNGTLSKADLVELAKRKLKSPRSKLQLATYKQQLLQQAATTTTTSDDV